MIQNVEYLRAELQLKGLADAECAMNSKVPLSSSEPPKTVSSQVPPAGVERLYSDRRGEDSMPPD